MFRLYMDSGKGYEYIRNYDSLVKLLSTLDNVILKSKSHNKILVIEHNEQLNYDNPIILYNGTEWGQNEYYNFRQAVLERIESNSLKR